MSKCKVAIVTFYDDNCVNYGRLSDKSKQAYCDKHGYQYFLHRTRISLEFDHQVWEKPKIMLQHFDAAEYLVWLDADAIIANLDFDVASIFNDKDIYMSKDNNGWNAGVFAVRTSHRSRAFLNRVLELYPQYRKAPFREQSAIAYLLDHDYRDAVLEVVPTTTWNSYDNVYHGGQTNIYKDGDFILHLPAENQLPKTYPPYREKRFFEINSKNKL